MMLSKVGQATSAHAADPAPGSAAAHGQGPRPGWPAKGRCTGLHDQHALSREVEIAHPHQAVGTALRAGSNQALLMQQCSSQVDMKCYA